MKFIDYNVAMTFILIIIIIIKKITWKYMTEVLVKSFIYRHLNDHIPSADDASARLSSFTEAAAPLGLKISWAKTKLQNLGSGSAPNSISVDGSNIESVEILSIT